MTDKTKKELIWENLQLRHEIMGYKLEKVFAEEESLNKRLDAIETTLKVMELLQDPQFIKELERLVDRNKSPESVIEDE